jgi:hypothetical protein
MAFAMLVQLPVERRRWPRMAFPMLSRKAVLLLQTRNHLKRMQRVLSRQLVVFRGRKNDYQRMYWVLFLHRRTHCCALGPLRPHSSADLQYFRGLPFSQRLLPYSPTKTNKQ